MIPDASQPPADPPAAPPDRREDAEDVVRALRRAGHIAYFAGGCVRDELLGLVPKDYDVATDAPPDRVRTLFPRTQAVGAAFGVILVRHGRSIIEVATFRADEQYLDGRRPSGVRFTTAEEDAKRRDFTVNGLFLDPLDGDRVIDHVGGQADLAAKVLRAIGEPKHRFGEDYLRMLRAARFAARFELTIELQTRQAIVDHADRLAQISPERINDELQRMLTPPSRLRAWDLLWDLRLIPVIFRFLPERAAGPNDRAMLFPRLAVGASISPPLALAAAGLCYRRQASAQRLTRELLVSKEVATLARALRRALRLSNDDDDGVANVLRVHQLLADAEPPVAVMKRFLAQSCSGESRLLLDALAEVEPPLAERVTWLRARLAELEKTDYAPPPLVTGDDLVAAGAVPGPAFKPALARAYDEQLEGRLTDKSEALHFALGLL